MNNLETKVPSLELSKKLWELVVRRESCFVWRVDAIGTRHDKRAVVFHRLSGPGNIKMPGDIPAYLTDELLEMLPQTIEQSDDFSPYYFNFHMTYTNDYKQYQARYGGAERDEFNHWKKDKTISRVFDTAPEALANLLIYLIEQGIVKVKDINK